MVEPYLDELFATVGDAIVARLLTAGEEAVRTDDLKALVLDEPDLGPVARSTMIMWYLGQWSPLPREWRDRHGANPLDVPRVVSAEAYAAGLVWPTAGAHPMGANPGGFGSWANPPEERDR